MHGSRCVGWSLPRFGKVRRRRPTRRSVMPPLPAHWTRKPRAKRNNWRPPHCDPHELSCFHVSGICARHRTLAMVTTRVPSTLCHTFVTRAQWGAPEYPSRLFIVYLCGNFHVVQITLHADRRWKRLAWSVSESTLATFRTLHVRVWPSQLDLAAWLRKVSFLCMVHVFCNCE